MMTTTPRLLRHATVAPGQVVQSGPPAPGIRQIVCDNIRRACIHNDIDRKLLAAMLGVSYPTVAGIWHGTRNVSTEDLWTIATAVEIPVDRFFVEHEQYDWQWL